jgi:acyl-CoA synthetase (NDP forming)
VPRHRFLPADRLAVEGTDDVDFGAGEVVLKVVSPQILHKSDVGGVRFCTGDTGSIESAARAMLVEVGERCPDAELRGVLVVEKLPIDANVPGQEILVSLRRDPAFGPVLMVGPGGLLTEWYGRLSGSASHTLFSAGDFRSERDLATLRRGAFGSLLLEPSRLHTTPPIDDSSLAAALERLVWLGELEDGDGHPLFEEIELNPAIARADSLLPLDVVVRLAAPPRPLRRERPVEKVGPLLHPRSAAIYGASATKPNAGRIILSNLKRAEGLDYGRLYVVHPKAERIDGVRCYPNTQALPEKVDLAVVSVPASAAPDTLDEIIRTDRAQSIILIPGGFAESGEGDRAASIQASLAASRDTESGGPVLVGGNCLGIVSKGEYNTFFLPQYKLPFHRAPGDDLVVISQSGAYLVTFTSNLDGIIFPRASISYGNEMDLTASDFFEYYLDHEPDVQCFSFYIEGFQPGEGERFLELVRRATDGGKSVCVYKAGQTPSGAKAAASHTASIAGDYEVVRSLLSAAGATVCQTLNMFEDITKIQTMLRAKLRAGRRVGVITNAGFEAGAMSDHLYSLELAEFSPETRGQLESLLPEIAHCGNPIDCTPMTRTAEFIRAVEIMVEAPEIDALVVSAIPVTPALNVLAPDLSGQHLENAFSMKSLPTELIRVFEQCPKPLVVAIDSGRLYDPSVLLLERAGVPVYRKIDRASRALSAVLAQS